MSSSLLHICRKQTIAQVLGFLFSLNGCTQELIEEHHDPHTFPSSIYIDAKFSDRQIEIINDSLAEWKNATDGLANETAIIGNTDNGNLDIIKPLNDDNSYVQSLDDSDETEVYGFSHSNGEHKPTSLFIITERIYSETLFKHVVLHELGHHYGLEHVSAVDALMYKSVISDMACITDYDLKQFCSIYDCSGRNIKQSC